MGGKWGGRTLRNVDYAASQWEVWKVRMLLKGTGIYLQKSISSKTPTCGVNNITSALSIRLHFFVCAKRCYDVEVDMTDFPRKPLLKVVARVFSMVARQLGIDQT